MQFLILTGTSGAGKMTAFHYLGDSGYYAVDNLPPRLLPALADACRAEGRERVLAVVDARVGQAITELPAVLDQLRANGTPAHLLFLDASDEALVRRFKETRRPHPLFESGRGTILDAVRAERRLLDELLARADKVVDTSSLSASEVGKVVADVLGETQQPGMVITVESFGFKHGIPIDADLVFDVRFLINPHYVPELKPLTGLSPQVAAYVHRHPLTEPFLEHLFAFVGFTLPQYLREGKAYLTIAIGCTGGQHRSVTVAEDLAEYLRREGYRVIVLHRDARPLPPAASADRDGGAENPLP